MEIRIEVFQETCDGIKTREIGEYPILLLDDVLTEQFIQHAAKIIEKRYQFLAILQEWAKPIHSGISRNLEELKIQYKPSLHVLETIGLSKIIEVL